MTLNSLLILSSQVAAGHPKASPEEQLCYAVQALLAEGPPCGFEMPKVRGGYVHLPWTWDGSLTAEDARALARMLLVAADECDAANKEAT